jgi:hypothetical protein
MNGCGWNEGVYGFGSLSVDYSVVGARHNL